MSCIIKVQPSQQPHYFRYRLRIDVAKLKLDVALHSLTDKHAKGKLKPKVFSILGVTPERKESGSTLKGRSSFSRTGHTAMRKALRLCSDMPALVALRHNPLVKTFGERIKLTGLAPKPVVGACMHKLAMLMSGALRSGQRFDVDFEKKKLALQDGI